MFEDFSSFLEMGGHAGFVWPSYGICFGLMALLVVQSLYSWQKRQKELVILEQSQGRRRTGQPTEKKSVERDGP